MSKQMGSHFIKYVSFVWLHCLLISTIIINATNCSSTERDALISFKQSLSDPSARLSSWVVGQNCCEWSGITCNVRSGKVTKIDLRNSLGSTIISQFFEDKNQLWLDPGFFWQNYKRTCLGGEISASLLQLKHLNYLDLSWNDFEGAPIPHFFGMLKSLRYLDLFSASFGGEIPTHLGNLSNLNYLDLSFDDKLVGYVENVDIGNLYAPNFLNAPNLHWLSGLSSLKYLNLGLVNLSSVQLNWMHVLNGLSSLSELHLSHCGISSNFDSSVALLNLTSLKVLDLSHNLIISSIPSWLSNLTSLSALNLELNYFKGTFPQDFVEMKNLQYLDLSGNEIGPNVNIHDRRPSFTQNLCTLRFLDLASNRFGVKLEEFFDSFSNCSRNSLEFLDLTGNGFVGEIPNSLGTSFKNLRSLNLSSNALSGSLPNSIGNLSLLQHLLISDNLLNGTIPSSFGQLSKLIEFESNENSWNTTIREVHLVNLTELEIFQVTTRKKQHLVFNISYDWIPPFRLKILYLTNCRVGPRFPAWLRIQSHLTRITLSNVGISDAVPNEWISNKSSGIISLDLSNNLLKGELSHLLTSQKTQNLPNDSIPLKYPNLRNLYLRNNLFSGPIPSNIHDLMPSLRGLDLSKNCLNGTFPSSIQKMIHLRILSMSDNKLSGELFDDWSRLNSLMVIDLANNSLYGQISTTIGLLTSLNKLILRNNNLHGEIPKSLQNCSFLNSLDLAENRLLYGNLPSWIGGAVSMLRLLNLRSNRFSGTIPKQWCNLPFLRILDLSNNLLSGEIPSCLHKWTSFVHKDYYDGPIFGYYYANGYDTGFYGENTRLIMKGTEFEYNTIMDYILTIDVSRNKLSGKIPNEITTLVQLGTLNLSNNDFVGTIPHNIGAMQQLETFDISCNHLSGRIPVSLGSLNFLTHLNMSFNDLTGRIPTSNHLQTLEDPSIYEGNPFLCGIPLQAKCPGDESSGSVPTSEDEENDSEIFGLCIGMAIGFPVGLNILFFTVFTNEARRIFYFRFIDRVNDNILTTVDFLKIGARRMIWRRS